MADHTYHYGVSRFYWDTFIKAIENNSTLELALMLERGIDPDIYWNDENAIMICTALMETDDATATVLFSKMDINEAWHSHKYTLLTHAVENGYAVVVDILLKHGANPHVVCADGESLLHKIDSAHMDEYIDIFVKAGINVNVQNPLTGNTPLYCAVARGRTYIVDKYLKLGANPDLENFDSRTPRQLAKQRSFFSAEDVFRKHDQKIMDHDVEYAR